MKHAVAKGVRGLLLLVFCNSCLPVCDSTLEPTLSLPFPSHRFASAPSSFSPLLKQEREQPWGNELLIADAFARECDFYRAITAYKRAAILGKGKASQERLLQIDYDIVLCYYLGGKHREAIALFEGGDLSQVDACFPAFPSLLLLLYESYLETDQPEKAAAVLTLIERASPESGEDLRLYEAIKEGRVEDVQFRVENGSEEDRKTFAFYQQWVKSPKRAAFLNALLPGAGYSYVGLQKSAVTSFLINTLFTAAAYQFFKNGYPAAGAITASLEAGWYFGGINGAAIEAKEFNNRLFEGVGKKILTDRCAFPILMFETSF